MMGKAPLDDDDMKMETTTSSGSATTHSCRPQKALDLSFLQREPNPDLWGDNNPPSATMPARPSMTENALFLTTAVAHLKDALDLIPDTEKQAYLEVVRLTPSLIKAESDPVKFLRTEDFNPWRAAQRLVLHWEYRKRLFQERWLLPMNESGAGALTKQDIGLLRSGWLTYVIPNDPAVPRIYLIDHGRYGGFGLDCFLRVMFYLGSFAQDTIAQTSVGVTAIRLVSSQDHGGEPPFTMELYRTAQECWKITKEALPFRLKSVLFLKEDAQQCRGQMMHLFLGRMASNVMRLLASQTPVTVPIPSKMKTATVLAERGIPNNVLPTSHGGTWTYEHMFAWKQIVAQEDDVGKLVKIPWCRRQEATSSREEEDRCKATKALYARRNYQKRILKQNQTRDEVETLQQEHERLQREHEFLQGLWQQAQDAVLVFSTQQQPSMNLQPQPKQQHGFDSVDFEPFVNDMAPDEEDGDNLLLGDFGLS